MKKKILIGIGFTFVILTAFIAYRIITTRNLSPRNTATFKNNGLEINVAYGRPFKKGRLIFGPEEKSALVPYGKYWRLGANESTEITFNKDVSFGGQSVKRGTYRVYTIPKEKLWTIVLNTELGKWGYWEANHDLDVAKTEATPSALNEPMEQFTIDFVDAGQAAILNFKWDLTKISVPVKSL